MNTFEYQKLDHHLQAGLPVFPTYKVFVAKFSPSVLWFKHAPRTQWEFATTIEKLTHSLWRKEKKMRIWMVETIKVKLVNKKGDERCIPWKNSFVWHTKIQFSDPYCSPQFCVLIFRPTLYLWFISIYFLKISWKSSF